MMEFILDSRIESFASFLRYCLSTGQDEWFDIVANNNTLVIKAAIDSIYQENHPKEEKKDYLADNIAKVKEMAKKG